MEKILFLAVILTLVACGSESDDPQELTVVQKVECDRDNLDVDTGWFGPGWDSELAQPIESRDEYVISTTVALPRDSEEFAAEFQDLNQTLIAELEQNPDVIAMNFAASTECGTARTLTVWKDQEALNAFVSSTTHLKAMMRAVTIIYGGRTTRFNAQNIPSWDDARAQLEKVDLFSY